MKDLEGVTPEIKAAWPESFRKYYEHFNAKGWEAEKIPLGGTRYAYWTCSTAVECYDWNITNDAGWRMPLASVLLPTDAHELADLYHALVAGNSRIIDSINHVIETGDPAPGIPEGGCSYWYAYKDRVNNAL